MPKGATLAADAELARERALAIVEDRGNPERAERLRAITVPMAVARHPHHLDAFQAELMAALAEIVEDQSRTIKGFEERIAALENPPAAAAGAAKKTGKKG